MVPRSFSPTNVQEAETDETISGIITNSIGQIKFVNT